MNETLNILARPHVLQVQVGVARCFGDGDIRRAGLLGGWAEPEAAHNWNDGPQAVLTLGTTPPDFACVLVVEGSPLIFAGRPHQDVVLFANGWRVGFWRLTDSLPVQLEAIIEPAQWQRRGKDALLQLVFDLRDSVKPSSRQDLAIGESADDRELAFCFRTIALYPAPHER